MKSRGIESVFETRFSPSRWSALGLCRGYPDIGAGIDWSQDPTNDDQDTESREHERVQLVLERITRERGAIDWIVAVRSCRAITTGSERAAISSTGVPE